MQIFIQPVGRYSVQNVISISRSKASGDWKSRRAKIQKSKCAKTFWPWERFPWNPILYEKNKDINMPQRICATLHHTNDIVRDGCGQTVQSMRRSTIAGWAHPKKNSRSLDLSDSIERADLPRQSSSVSVVFPKDLLCRRFSARARPPQKTTPWRLFRQWPKYQPTAKHTRRI